MEKTISLKDFEISLDVLIDLISFLETARNESGGSLPLEILYEQYNLSEEIWLKVFELIKKITGLNRFKIINAETTRAISDFAILTQGKYCDFESFSALYTDMIEILNEYKELFEISKYGIRLSKLGLGIATKVQRSLNLRENGTLTIGDYLIKLK